MRGIRFGEVRSADYYRSVGAGSGSMGLMLRTNLKTQHFYAVGLIGLMAGLAVAWRPLVALAVIGIAVVAAVLVVHARIASPLLVVIAVPMARPNFLGETFSAVAGALVLVAAGLALADDRRRLPLVDRRYSSLGSVAFWLAIAYAWLLARSGFVSFDIPVRPLLQSVLLVVCVVAAMTVVVADPRRGRVVAWGFIALMLIQCASFAVTVIVWAGAGMGTGLLALIPGTLHSFETSVYFPGTITTATQMVFGFTFPRFDGIGREPGWMAMWCAFTYFLIPRLTNRRMRFTRILLLLGLLGTFSTAGFGVFLVVWTLETFLRPRPGTNPLFGYLRQVAGVVFMAGAVWLAIKAPVFGLQAKSTFNAISVSDRSEATRAGWLALQTSPMTGFQGGGLAGVNLIAAIAAAGLPFTLAILAALYMPLRAHPERWLAVSPVAVLALTLLTSQPSLDSTWVYAAAVMAYAVTQTSHAPSELATGGTPLPASTRPRAHPVAVGNGKEAHRL